MIGHNYNRTLHAKGLFVYCSRCGLVKLGNRATAKAIQKPCGGLRDLEDEEYLKITTRKK